MFGCGGSQKFLQAHSQRILFRTVPAMQNNRVLYHGLRSSFGMACKRTYRAAGMVAYGQDRLHGQQPVLPAASG